jgi:hypothetical protein
VTRGLNRLADTADSEREQDPEVDATFAGAGQPAGERRQRREGNGHRRGGAARTEEATPEAKPWTRQRGETNAQGTRRSKPSRACETLRAEHRRDRESWRTVDSSC